MNGRGPAACAVRALHSAGSRSPISRLVHRSPCWGKASGSAGARHSSEPAWNSIGMMTGTAGGAGPSSLLTANGPSS
jgi:hypothetical protein